MNGDYYSGQANSNLPSRRHFNFVSARDMNAQAVDDFYENVLIANEGTYLFDYSKVDSVLAKIQTVNQGGTGYEYRTD